MEGLKQERFILPSADTLERAGLAGRARARKAAALTMTQAMGGLQGLFARTDPFSRQLRNWGLSGLNQSGLLKHWLARQAMGTAT